MIESYLNQDAVLYRRTGVNQYNEPEYEQIPIKCRYEYTNRLVRDAQGEQVPSDARFFTTEPVKPGDRIVIGEEDRMVITAGGQPDLSGGIEFYEAAV
ncbi:hypothetical protein [Sporolactobacillus terrae]|uniref:Uncharacterized protein n=1 Tax=Sporolactobacillus terrae TaxID=269673 RepID=A0A5K7WYG3_9BACL|nr:hypothetical protein [Sporolactobacillus terrae]BBN97500.1 hypothetical protein St703_02050 [Sporolactobacillus terrae]